MKLKSEILKDKNNKIISIEDFEYNRNGKLFKQTFKDENGKRRFYKVLEYDKDENCIKKTEYSNNNTIQVSFEYYYDGKNLIKTIERTAEGEIWNWTEILTDAKNNIKIYLAKDENGLVIHKTEENLFDNSEKRYNSENQLYEIHIPKFDSKNRIIEKLVIDKDGKEKEIHLYEYLDNKVIWKYFLNHCLIKIEENTYDDNQNLIHYIRKDKNGSCLEWYSFEYDEFNNKTKYIWGLKEGKEIGFNIFELIYFND